jgi:hypothetical protein
MKPLLNVLLFSAWVTLYLAAVYWIGRYRRAQAHALGPEGRDHYRADRDVGLWLIVFILGLVLLFAAYLATKATGQLM